jgi:hypothetical protein
MLFILCSENIIFMYKTNVWTHCIDKNTISIPPVFFWHLMSLKQVGQIEILLLCIWFVQCWVCK